MGGQFGRTDETAPAKDDDSSTPPQGPQSTLFQCADCESVFVAVDKQTCDTCDVAVEEIPSTLSRTQ